MRNLAWALALLLLLAGCATVKKPDVCEEKASLSFTRGVKDAQTGAAHSSSCKGNSARAYREGFESRKQRGLSSLSRRVQEFPAWVCEVESSAKIFTGVGDSVEEASRAARKTCSVHFQASSCEQAECSRSL